MNTSMVNSLGSVPHYPNAPAPYSNLEGYDITGQHNSQNPNSAIHQPTANNTSFSFKRAHDPEDDLDSDGNPTPKDSKDNKRKIKIEYIQDKSRRHITFSKRKAGIMKKAYELSTLTGTQVLLLVVSETGLVYTFTTPKLQPLVTKPEGKNLIQSCLNAPDMPAMPFVGNSGMSGNAGGATGNANHHYSMYNDLPHSSNSNTLDSGKQSSNHPASLNSTPSLNSASYPNATPTLSNYGYNPYSGNGMPSPLAMPVNANGTSSANMFPPPQMQGYNLANYHKSHQSMGSEYWSPTQQSPLPSPGLNQSTRASRNDSN